MVDLSLYQSHIRDAKINNAPAEEHGGLFLDLLFLQGFKVEGNIVHGELTRISDPTDKPGKQSGWYIFHQGDTVSVGIYGSWKQPDDKQVWYSKTENTLTFNERTQTAQKIKEAQEQQRIKREKEQESVSKEASILYTTLPDANDDVPYLKKKQVKAFPNTKMDGDKLVIPVIYDNIITSTQTIYPDSFKRFMTGGKTKGCYFVLEGDDSIIYIAEGYATAASVAEATGNMVYVAFSAHNLYEVASYVKHKHGKIIICGDNDDTCRTKATQIQESMAIEAIFPPSEHNDFNDWWVADRDGVIKFFDKKPEVKHEEEICIHNFRPSGVIADIIDYYNATAKKPQPLFAIQTAIATCSIILARNFETNFENRASLFLMNIAKSGTGKEHSKKIIEKILEATNNDHLISGDGYTSQSAVISACQERPRHITIIDEFSKYLQASQNKQSGGHMAEANATLMQAIGRLEGKLRAKARATIGMNNAQKKDLQNQTVICPAITLLAMTTPEDFFSTIGAEAIKDGFINRFIICISDAKREMPLSKEPMDVPESIINWAQKIADRRGLSGESSVLEPVVHMINFAFECYDIQKKFQQYCIDIANKNEQFGLAEISGRSAEMSYRLALIIALSENPNTDKIEAHHQEQAINWVKFNLERLISELKSSVSNSNHEASKKEILKALRQSNGVSKSDMFKRPPFSKYGRKILDEILSELLEAELVTEEIEEKTGAGRRKTIWKAI